MSSDQSESAMGRFVRPHPNAAKVFAYILAQWIRYRRWRAECPSCGEQRQKLVPHGGCCFNTDCRRCALGVVDDAR